ncbi:MAG: dCTP deaminase [bacterium]
MYLTRSSLVDLYKKKEIIIRPLLSEKQFGEISLDLRLGTDFLVSYQGRQAFIDAAGVDINRPISSSFQETKRLVGETILLHPHQTVLCSTLEYIKLPNNIFLDLTTRSSYSRLGITISSIVQPGYCGCVSLELTNNNNNPIKIRVGAALIQARFFQLDQETDYFNTERKYTCQVRPVASKANLDEELIYLDNFFKS